MIIFAMLLRCCKLDVHGPEGNFWEDLELKITECIRNTLDRRAQFYEDEIRKLSEQRFMPIWNFCNFFILKESLAFIFEMAHLHEDALREYDELELCYLETGSFPTSISLSCRSVAAKISCFVYLLYFIFLGFDKPDMYLYLLKHLGSVFIQQTDFFFQVFFF
jgi:hypothetical protein